MAKRKSAVKAVEPTKKARKVVEEPIEESESDMEVAAQIDSDDDLESEDDLDDLDNDDESNELNDEDELDGSADDLDGSEGFLSEDEDAEDDDGEEKAVDPEKAAKRKEQKEQRKERKLQRENGQEIYEIKKIWEKLRNKTTPAAERKELVEKSFELVNGKFADLVFRHDSSRVVQTIFKFCDQEKRITITNALKGRYVDLAKSSYGKYLLVKMLHYGSAQTRKQIIDELHGNFRKLMGHREGAYVIEDTFRDYSTAAQRRQILREFYGSGYAIFKNAGEDKSNLSEIIAATPEKKKYLLENLNQVITTAVNKGSIGFEIIHAAMLEYIRNIDPKSSDRETFVDLVSEQIAEMVHTQAGSRVASLVFAMATAKERKKLIKGLREFGDKLMMDQFGNLVLITIFSTVDDTVLVQKSFIPMIEDNITELAKHKYGRRPLVYLLAGRSTRYFPKDVQERFEEVDEVKAETSKKDDEVRRKELLTSISPVLFQAVINNTNDLVRDSLGMQFIGEVLINGERGDGELWQATVEAVANAFAGSPTSDKHPLVVNPFSTRVLKLLVKEIPEFAKVLLPIVSEHVADWTLGEGTFVVVALIENVGDKDLTKSVKKHRKALEKTQPKGAKILLELLA